MYRIIRLFIKENLYLKSYRLKNRNQRIHTGGLMHRGGGGGGAYTSSNTSVKEKVGLSEGGCTRGDL